ncbi:intraflagellar transport-associated protein [Erethizon dorsatum]
MPAPILGLEVMDKDQLMEEVLDKFVNSHEQTYEEFLSTFTYLSKEHNVTERRAFGLDASQNTFTSVEFIHKNEPHDHCLRNTSTFLCTSPQCLEEEQIVLDEGQKVGNFFQGDLNRAGKVKVDNFLDLEDLDVDEELKPQISKDLLLLPGEVEGDISSSAPSYIPSVPQPRTTEVKPKPAIKRKEQEEETLEDEVLPFSLDEDFDYDGVTLTPKFTSAELETMKELLKQERKNTNTDVWEPHA